jgi:hypothetical protein
MLGDCIADRKVAVCQLLTFISVSKRKKEEGRRKKEEGRGKREEGRGKREEGRGKREEGRKKLTHLNGFRVKKREEEKSFFERGF